MSESNRYSRGKIYKIHRDDCDDVYIGSTIASTLARRLSHHVHGMRHGETKCTSRHLVNRPGYTITLLELYPCGSKDELRAREQHYIDTTVTAINKYKAFTGLNEVEYMRQYRLDHKEYVNKGKKYNRQYHQDHKEQRNECSRQYHQNHKETIKKEKSIKVTCDCGTIVKQGSIWNHKQTKKHHTLLAAKATEQ